MDEFNPSQSIENQSINPESRLPQPEVWQVLVVQLGFFVMGAGVSAMLFVAIAWVMGWPIESLLTGESGPTERLATRVQLGLGHLFGFCLSGWLTAWIFYRSITQNMPDWRDYLGVRRWPSAVMAALAVLLMAVSIPLVLYAYNLNQMIPMPDSFRLMEDQTAEALKGLLQMDGWAELLANVCIIALLPAIGEELVFRGILQQQIMRRASSPWVAIVLTSIIFSAIHMQFEGFLPRFLLGMLLGWLYWRTGNFWVPVIAHFFNNAIQVIGQYLYGHELSSVDLEQDIQVPLVVAAVSAFMVWATIRMINSVLSKK